MSFPEKQAYDEHLQKMKDFNESTSSDAWDDDAEKRWQTMQEEEEVLSTAFHQAKEKRERDKFLAETEKQRDVQRFEDAGTAGEMRANRDSRDQGQTWEQRNALAIRGYFMGKRAKTVHRRAMERLGVDGDSELNLRYNTDLQASMPSNGRGLVECAGGRMSNWNFRQQSTALDTTGGEVVIPMQMLMELEFALLQFGGTRGISSVTRTAGGQDIGWPTTNDTGNAATIVAENAAISQQDMVFARVTTSPYKYVSGYIPVSWELMADANQSMDAIVGRAIGERIARGQAGHLTIGTGTGQPRGWTIDAASGGTLTTDDSPTYDETVTLQHTVDPAYRSNGTFVMHDDVLANMKKLKDSQNRPIWLPSFASSEPATILGSPYVVDNSLGSGGTAKSFGYGDFSRYKIHQAGSITVMRLTELHALNGQVTFLAWDRMDARLLDAGTNPVAVTTNPA